MATTNQIPAQLAQQTTTLTTQPTFAAPVALTLIPNGVEPFPMEATAEIQKQDSNTQWLTIATLGIAQRQVVLQTSGVYRVVKQRSNFAYGVDLDT